MQRTRWSCDHGLSWRACHFSRLWSSSSATELVMIQSIIFKVSRSDTSFISSRFVGGFIFIYIYINIWPSLSIFIFKKPHWMGVQTFTHSCRCSHFCTFYKAQTLIDEYTLFMDEYRLFLSQWFFFYSVCIYRKRQKRQHRSSEHWSSFRPRP